MGMLSKHPQKSSIMKRFGNQHRTKRFTQREIMHCVALYWTPELSRNWIAWQFRNFERKPDDIMRSIRRYAYHPYYRKKWEHLGRRNLEFIGLDEVQAYYDRHPPTRKFIPSWALIVMIDLVKQGFTKAEVARRFGISRASVVNAINRRTIFEPSRAFSDRENLTGQHGSKDMTIPLEVLKDRQKTYARKRKWEKKRKKNVQKTMGKSP